MTRTLDKPRLGMLDEIANVVMGQSPVGSSYNHDRVGAPLINGPTEFTARHPVPKQWTTAPIRFCESRDVLICVRGSSTGRVNVADAAYCIGRGVAAVRASGRNSQTYVQYALSAMVAELLKLQTGSTFPSIDSRVIRGGSILIPDPHEQQRIGEALRDADETIAALERLIAKKKAIKQGAMQQLLTGRTRLPGFAGEWTMRKIDDFAQVKAGGTPSTAVARYWGGTIRWMNSGEIHSKRVHEVQGRITVDGFRESAAQLLPVGTVLMALAGQGKTRGTVAVSRVELSTNQSIAGILPGGEHDPEFLYYNLDTRYEELRGESSGEGGRGGLNLTIIKNLHVYMPSLDEQRAIAKVFGDADDEIDLLKRRLVKARHVKQGMMQELLTGRTRLPASEVAA